jgi:hypothetical protein
LANQKNINLRAGGCWNHQEIQKNTLKKDIGNPYKTSYLEQRFGQPEAWLYSWLGFAYKTNTIALLTRFSSSVLGETGLGAILMYVFALGPW